MSGARVSLFHLRDLKFQPLLCNRKNNYVARACVSSQSTSEFYCIKITTSRGIPACELLLGLKVEH
jgi:hypothetical protein